MRILVTGAQGTLGKRVVEVVLARGHEVFLGTSRDVLIHDPASVYRAIEHVNPQVIINCAGRVPGADGVDMALSNTLGPHVLASTKIPLVHMSTDCVFSGTRLGWQAPGDPTDPIDLYGRTKLAGEPLEEHVTVVRGSFIAPESGLLHWFLTNSGRKIEIYREAYWNGGTAMQMAEALVTLAEARPTQHIVHVAGPWTASKANILTDIAIGLRERGWKIPKMIGTSVPHINRRLLPDIELPPVTQVTDAAIEDCAEWLNL